MKKISRYSISINNYLGQLFYHCSASTVDEARVICNQALKEGATQVEFRSNKGGSVFKKKNTWNEWREIKY